MEYRGSTVVLIVGAIAVLLGGLAYGSRVSHKNNVQTQGSMDVDIMASNVNKNVQKHYCSPRGVTDDAKCKALLEKVEKDCEDKRKKLKKNKVLKFVPDFLKACDESAQIKLLEKSPADDKLMGDLGRAVKVCELGVNHVCNAWTCPTWCEMSNKEATEKVKACKSKCHEQCDNVNIIAGSIAPDEAEDDADRKTAYEKLKEMQTDDSSIILQAMLREHIVKCTCQRRTWKLNKDTWGDVCYQGSQGLQPKQLWCEWDEMPSWQALKEDSKTEEYSTKPKCAVKAGVVLKVSLSKKPSKSQRVSMHGELLAKIITKLPEENIGRREVIDLSLVKVDSLYSNELQITNPDWEGSGEDDAIKVKNALFNKGESNGILQECNAEERVDLGETLEDFGACITDPPGAPRMVAAKGDNDSGPPADYYKDAPAQDSGDGGSGAAQISASALVFLVVAAAASVH